MSGNGLSDDGYCEGCGTKVEISEPRVDNPGVMREQGGDAAGRVSVTYGGRVIHQCADGEYLPPDQVAPPKSP